MKIAISILLNNFETKKNNFETQKNREFNLIGITLNKNNLLEICKKYLLNSDKLSDSELRIIRLIKNYYQKIEHEFNIFELYEISKVKDRELDKIFEMIKKLKLDLSNVDLVFPYIITLVELDGFYKLIYYRLIYDNFDINNIHKDIDIIEFIIEKNPEIFKYWTKVLGKEKLKNILYNSSKEDITDFLISKVFSKEELKDILYEAIEVKKESITDFLISKVFSKKELKEILYESIEVKKESITDFLVSKVFSKKELKEMLYESIETKKENITDFLVSKVFSKMELKEIIFDLIFNVFDNNKIEELFNKDKLDKLVKIKDEHNRTILHYAVLQNKIDLVKFLLSNYWKQIDVDLIDNFGYTAKDYAQNNKIITKIFNYFKAFRKLNSINIFILSIFSFITIFLLWKLFVLLTSLFYKDNSFSVVNNTLDTIYWLFFNIIALILYIFILFPFVKLILRRIYDKKI
jgi:uncharacterized protein (DUF1778 family)